MRYLLDTHVLLWWVADPVRLTAEQTKALTSGSEEPLLVSDISLWDPEASLLVER